MIRHRFKVMGVRPFPVEMLVHDSCFPKTKEDARAILELPCPVAQLPDSKPEEPLTVSLVSMRDKRDWLPSIGHWNKRGWSVIEVVDE